MGRETEIELVGQALDRSDPAPVALFIHGPGGIGKSALLEATVEATKGRGQALHLLDAREIPPTRAALQERLDAVDLAAPALIAIDSFELIEAAGGWLARSFLPSLAERSTLILAGRNRPGAEWPPGAGVRELRLGPLSEDAARDLLAARAVDRAEADRIVAWARGHPLALTLAAGVAVEGVSWGPEPAKAPEDLVRSIVRSLGEVEVDSGHLPTLVVAAIARSTTPALLTAALPEHEADREWDWLAARSFVEPVGEGIALHALLRDAIRADLRHRDPLLGRRIKRRVADHLYEVAERDGRLDPVIDLSYLIENPGLRWGFIWEASASYYPDAPRPGDAEEIDRALADPEVEPIGGGAEVWELTRPFFERMPELAVVVRDSSGAIRGFTFVPSTAVEDPDLEALPLIGPCLQHGRGLSPRGEALVMPYMCDLTGNPLSGMVGMLANAAVLRSSRANPRYTYMTINAAVEMGRLFAEAVGAKRVPELDATVGVPMEAWLIDFGPGGFIANQRELVYRELGLEPPPRPAESARSVRTEEVRDALRHLRDPAELARSPLASGEGTEERAASVRAKLTAAIEESFAGGPEDETRREAIVAGYLDGDIGHDAAASRLYLSRATYFRRLREGVERIADHLSAGKR